MIFSHQLARPFYPEFTGLIILTQPDPQETKVPSISTEVERFHKNLALIKLFGILNPHEEHEEYSYNYTSFLNNLQKVQNVEGLILQPIITGV